MVAWRSRQRGLEQGDMIPPNGGHGASKIKVPETTVASPAGLEPATP